MLFIWNYSGLREKIPPGKKNFKTLKAYTSKTKRSCTKLTRIKHALTSIIYGMYTFSIRDLLKEDHCDTSG